MTAIDQRVVRALRRGCPGRSGVLSSGALAGSLVAMAFLFVYLSAAALAQVPRTIVDEWAAVTPPPVPALRAVTVDPRTTALLVLDVQRQNCNLERRPRCVASIPRIAALLARAVARGMPVVYSTVTGATEADIWLQVRPLGGGAHRQLRSRQVLRHRPGEDPQGSRHQDRHPGGHRGQWRGPPGEHRGVAAGAPGCPPGGRAVGFKSLRRAVHGLAPDECADHQRPHHADQERHDQLLTSRRARHF